MGDKLFRITLLAVQEETYSVPFIDILNKLEKFEIIPQTADWIRLRKIRNEVSHEYPGLDEEAIVALNNLFTAKDLLKQTYTNCQQFLKSHDVL